VIPSIPESDPSVAVPDNTGGEYKGGLSLSHSSSVLEGLAEVLAGDQAGVLADVEPRARERLLTFFQRTAGGERFMQAIDGLDTSWPEVHMWLRKLGPVGRDLYEVAKECGHVMRQCKRETALDKRGVEGWEEPVRYKGDLVGYVRKFSDKCLELAVRAGDPSKYADRQQLDVSGTIVRFDIGIQRKGDTQAAPIDVDGVES